MRRACPFNAPHHHVFFSADPCLPAYRSSIGPFDYAYGWSETSVFCYLSCEASTMACRLPSRRRACCVKLVDRRAYLGLSLLS